MVFERMNKMKQPDSSVLKVKCAQPVTRITRTSEDGIFPGSFFAAIYGLFGNYLAAVLQLETQLFL